MKNYFLAHKRAFIFLAIALVVILLSSFCGNMVQNNAYRVTVTDLRDVDATDYGVDSADLIKADLSAIGGSSSVTVTGFVKSGLLFKPDTATPTSKAPAVVLTHGYLNNREMQLPFAIELARRGFVVLVIDRENHGNNTDVSASVYSNYGTTSYGYSVNGAYGASLYNAAAFLYYQDYVNGSLIGVSGHSMGGAATNSALLIDKTASEAENSAPSIIKAGLVQANNPCEAAYSINVTVGILKANDDEFFFKSTLADGTPSISRQYLNSVSAANFVGLTGYGDQADSIQVKNGVLYSGGLELVSTPGQVPGVPFRVIYEADEIHPLNHFSIPSTANLVSFFYNALGTPLFNTYLEETNQVWWVKEMFATIGLVGFFMLVLPVADLLLTLPCFKSLRKKKVVNADGVEVDERELLPALKTPRQHVSYWFAALATTLFSGFMIQPIFTGSWSSLSKLFFTQNTYFPQDTTGKVATWAIVCGLFALLVTGLVWLTNHIINVVKYKENASQYDSHPLAAAKIGGPVNFFKTIALGMMVVFAMYLVVFINWGIWKVDFRFWTFDVKVFNVTNMLPTMLRYSCAFFIFYAINSIFNQTYKVKNLPEWATTAINCVFSVLGIFIVMVIQYATFKSTGVLWQSDMNLSYIVLFPIIPVLIIATVLSRRLYKRTGNAWLGAVVNTLVFTIMTVANTSASYSYAGFFA